MITKIHMLALLIIISFIFQSYSSNAEQLPLIIEYIMNYTTPANQLKPTVENLFNKATFAQIKTSYVDIKDGAATATYIGSNRSEKSDSPFQTTVYNDSYKLNVTFSANVTRLNYPIHKVHKCHVQITQIFVTYTKQVNINDGKGIISNYSDTFTSRSFKQFECDNKASDIQKKHILQAINTTESSSIYVQLHKIIMKTKDLLQNYSMKIPLSAIYKQNPYVYDYYGSKVSIDVSTTKASQIHDTGVKNCIKATLPVNTYVPSTFPQYKYPYNLFISSQFIMNWIENSVKSYQKWKSIMINKQNMRTRLFRFRLIDYEYIVPKLLEKYPNMYMNDTSLACSVLSYQSSIISDGGQWVVNLKWNCEASINITSGKQVFLNFEPQISYKLQIKVDSSSSTLTVYARPQQVTKLNFNIINDYIVMDAILVKRFIEQGLFEFANYPIGNRFKVSNGATMISVMSQGIWIG